MSRSSTQPDRDEQLALLITGLSDQLRGGRTADVETVARNHPDLAAEQVEYAVKSLGFRGVGVGGSVAGLELADPKFQRLLRNVLHHFGVKR